MDIKALGRAVTAIRQARNESGRAMARKLGISNVHLHHIEKGTEGVSLELLDKFTEVYGVNPYVMVVEPRLELCRVILDEWQNQQGHNRCWYYPEIFDSLCALLGVKNKRPKELPSEEDFKSGCERYRRLEYLSKGDSKSRQTVGV